MKIAEFQRLIEDIYYERDSARGLAGTHMWFCEEVGELTRALRRGHDLRRRSGQDHRQGNLRRRAG